MRSAYQRNELVGDDEPPFGAYRPNLMQSLALRLVSIPPFYRGIFRRRSADLVRGLGRAGIVDFRRNGACYRLRSAANLIEDAILVHPRYNRRELDFLLEGTPAGGVFVDLGANIGLYTLPLALKAGPEGRVVAIDANPDIVKALAFNAGATGLANVDIACVAVGDGDKTVRLEMRKDDFAIVETHEDPDGEITMKPLADILKAASINSVDSLKADIEGFEDRALIPFLSSASPALIPGRIVIEHAASADWQQDLAAWLVAFGYRLIAKERSNSLYAFDGKVHQ